MKEERVELRIAALLDAADVEQARVREAITELKAGGESLQRVVKSAASEATREALKALQTDIDHARSVVADLQRLSLWRAAWQHVWVALVAIAITVLAVWWYVPSVSEMTALRSERAQLQASIEDLTARGGRIKLNTCGNSGERKRLCVLVDQTAGRFGSVQSGEIYMIAKGY
jgi:hypothetical protein